MHEALKQAEKEDSLTQANEIFSNFESYPYFDVEKQKGAMQQGGLGGGLKLRQTVIGVSVETRPEATVTLNNIASSLK